MGKTRVRNKWPKSNSCNNFQIYGKRWTGGRWWRKACSPFQTVCYRLRFLTSNVWLTIVSIQTIQRPIKLIRKMGQHISIRWNSSSIRMDRNITWKCCKKSNTLRLRSNTNMATQKGLTINDELCLSRSCRNDWRNASVSKTKTICRIKTIRNAQLTKTKQRKWHNRRT